MRSLILPITMLPLALGACAKEQNMADTQVKRDQEFRERIGFDRVTEDGPPTAGVVARWPDPATATPFQGQEWTVANDTLWPAKNGVARKWVLKNGDLAIMLTIFVSSQGTGPARQFLLDTATATMMGLPPYEPSREPLGTLCVVNLEPGGEDRIWFYRNVCFHARSLGPGVDVLGLGAWLQEIAEAHVVDDVAAHRPPVLRVDASAEELAAGDTLSLAAILPQGADPERYLIEIEQVGEAFDIEWYEDLEAALTAQRPGSAEIRVQVIDSLTLLETSSTVTANVQPPRE